MIPFKRLAVWFVLLLEAAGLVALLNAPCAAARAFPDPSHGVLDPPTNSCSAEHPTRKVHSVPGGETEGQSLLLADDGVFESQWFCDQDRDLPRPELDLDWCLANWHNGKLVPYEG